MLIKIRKIGRLFRNRLFSTSFERALRDRVRRPIDTPTVHAPLITVEAVEDPFYFSHFGEIIASIRAHGNLRVEQLVTRSFSVGASRSLKQFAFNLIRHNTLTDWKWIRLYCAYCDHVAFRAAGWISPIAELRIFLRAWTLWRAIGSKDELAALTVRGVLVGDLVIDSYLRFKPSPTIVLTDPYLLVVVWQMLKDIEKTFAYFETRKTKIYLTTYTTYVQHGVPARVAAFLEITVVAFGNAQNFYKFITRDDVFQTKKPTNYCRDFETLSNQEGKLAAADSSLAARISGKIDASILSSKTSPYMVQTTDVPDMRGSVVVFLHDFYDSVHIYRWIVFHDFWEWLCFTIEALCAAKIPFYLKPHPNQIAESAEVLVRLRKLYPDLKFVPPLLTNKQLVDAGMACAVTVYGTVASEMAYLGVPSISCGENPHVSFSFCRTARTKEEYRALLESVNDRPVDRAALKKEACAFFYMHNLHIDADEGTARDNLSKVITAMWFSGEPTFEDVETGFQALTGDPGFKQFIGTLLTRLNRN